MKQENTPLCVQNAEGTGSKKEREKQEKRGKKMINTKQIEIFLIMAEKCSFSETAKIMYTTQPTISRQIKMLEQELGVKLFDRNKRHVNITEAGIFWMRRFKRIIKMMEVEMGRTDQMLEKVKKVEVSIGSIEDGKKGAKI